MQSVVLGPACRAGAHVCVGIAGPHIQSGALATSEKVPSPAEYRALRIRIDPPASFRRKGETRVSHRLSTRHNRTKALLRRCACYAATRAFCVPSRCTSLAPSVLAEKRNSLPSSHIRCMITASLRRLPRRRVCAPAWRRRAPRRRRPWRCGRPGRPTCPTAHAAASIQNARRQASICENARGRRSPL